MDILMVFGFNFFHFMLLPFIDEAMERQQKNKLPFLVQWSSR
jgi:hypothetical protein